MLRCIVLADDEAEVMHACHTLRKSVGPLAAADLDALVAQVASFTHAEYVGIEFCTALASKLEERGDEAACSDATLKLILEFMTAHADSEAMQYQALSALISIVYCIPALQRAFVAQGGLPVLNAVSDNHLVSDRACLCVEHVKSSLAVLEALRPQIIAAGCLTRTFAVMDHYVDNEELQSTCCGVLANVAVDDACRAAVIAGGGVDRVRKLREAEDETDTSTSAYKALAMLEAVSAWNAVAVL